MSPHVIERSNSKVPNEYIDAETEVGWPNSLDPMDPEIARVMDLQKLIACKTCVYPIAFLAGIKYLIKNNENRLIGLVLPIADVFTEVQVVDVGLVRQWQNKIYCPCCGVELNFSDRTFRPESDECTRFANIFSYQDGEERERCVILFPAIVTNGTIREIHTRFNHINQY